MLSQLLCVSLKCLPSAKHVGLKSCSVFEQVGGT